MIFQNLRDNPEPLLIKIKKGIADMTEKRFRNNRIQLRFSSEEKEFFETLFEKSRFTNRNDFIIHLLRNCKIINVRLNDGQLNQVHIDLSQIANNINQIARRINSTNSIYQDDINDILEIKNQLEDIRTDLHLLYKAVKVQRA